MELKQSGAEEIEKLKLERVQMEALRQKMQEALNNPFLQADVRRKYKIAIPEYEKRIKSISGKLKTLEMLRNFDPDNYSLPTHYQHHKK
ncbi:MAG: hypothetical protein PHG91_06930 [Syntrophales bacterium]|nr:hypothetical protein [Syntrophales bacterium]MDD5233111.1 hypothetical protein [Syntrophales bacterium]MDD5532464.1 hypothetical protein [Syntrophales bacterium]